jgi:hypothetical protein
MDQVRRVGIAAPYSQFLRDVKARKATLLALRLTGLSALEAHYAGCNVVKQYSPVAPGQR